MKKFLKTLFLSCLLLFGLFGMLVAQTTRVSPITTIACSAGSFISALTSSGTLTCTAAGANPTATIGTSAVNGTATTYMRSDAAPAAPQASSSTFGLMKVDNTTQTASGGVVSTAATTINGTTCTPGGSCSIAGAATTLAAGTSVSLTAPREYYVCTGTCTVTPPVPSAGYEFCVYNDNNISTVITLAALGSSSMYENTARTAYGTAGTGTFVSGGAVGDKVCIVGRDSTHYSTLSYQGTWTVN